MCSYSFRLAPLRLKVASIVPRLPAPGGLSSGRSEGITPAVEEVDRQYLCFLKEGGKGGQPVETAHITLIGKDMRHIKMKPIQM